MKFPGKWMDSEKAYTEGGNQQQERQTTHVLSCLWILALNIQIYMF